MPCSENRRAASPPRHPPFNLVMGFADPTLTVDQLSAAGLKRISVGGAMARHVLAAFLKSAREMKDQGAFTFVREMAPIKEVRAAFARR
jgi:2-methylisocitrate lyase-like PEP mutase family enzyme